jgi:hypothetical protein
LNNATSSFQCSELELSLSRFLLGVHRKTSPLGIRGELGLYPLVIDIIGTIIMYEKHLMSEKSSELLEMPTNKTPQHQTVSHGSVKYIN